MPIARIRTVTTGLAGGPYLSTFYRAYLESTTVGEYIGDVFEFWNDVAGVVASGATMTTESDVAVINEVNGDVLEVLSGNPGVTLGSGGSSAEWTAKQGLLRLNSGDYVDGRQIAGRLFIPGVVTEAGEQAPTVAYRNVVTVAAQTLVATSSSNGPWVVWRRPRVATETLPARVGTTRAVASPICSPRWAILRSRRG